MSLRPSQAAMATTDEAELAAALTLVVAEVANSMAVKVEKEEINGSVIVTKNSKYKMLFVVRQNRRRGRKTSTMSLLIFRFLHDSDSPIGCLVNSVFTSSDKNSNWFMTCLWFSCLDKAFWLLLTIIQSQR